LLNPQTGKAIKIPVKNVMKFKIGMKLDEAVPQQDSGL